ncbi:sigma-70 factor domain-containing protein, partial [Streptomyces sp. NPDC059956]
MFVSASTSRTLPPEIADSESVMALIERGKAEGQIAGDDVRRAFEADQIPATQWKNVLRSLNQILEEEGVTLMVSAAESPKRTPRKSVAAKSPVKRTATEPVAKKAAAKTPAAAVPDAVAGAAEPDPVDTGADALAEGTATEPAAKKTAAKKTAAKKTAPAKKTAAKKTAAKKTAAKKDSDEAGDEETTEDGPGAAKAESEDEEEGAESKGFVISDDEDDAPAQQVAVAGATADPVKDYLKQIGKVPLLNAEQEVELAKRIEAG